jgi:NADPH:quinone reductase-like Zn-dependent oxidoreductase
VDRVFPLAEAARAHEYLEGRLTRGKVLLRT